MLMYDNDLGRPVWRRVPEDRKLIRFMRTPFTPPGASPTPIGV